MLLCLLYSPEFLSIHLVTAFFQDAFPQVKLDHIALRFQTWCNSPDSNVLPFWATQFSIFTLSLQQEDFCCTKISPGLDHDILLSGHSVLPWKTASSLQMLLRVRILAFCVFANGLLLADLTEETGSKYSGIICFNCFHSDNVISSL